MASTAFAAGVEAGHGPHPSAASFSTAAQTHVGVHQHNNSTNSTSTSSASNTSFNSNNSIFDAHRQNHNSSKLPAFRFADLKKDAIVPPSLLQHIPPSPVSPQPNSADRAVADGCQQQQQQRDAHDQQQNPTRQNDLHNNRTSTQNLPDKSPSPETPHSNPHQPTLPRTRASTFQTSPATTSNNPDPSTGSKRPASFPDPPSVVGISFANKSQSPSATAPVAKRRLTASGVAETLSSHQTLNTTAHVTEDPGSTTEWAQGQRELLLSKTNETTKSDERRKSRPPVSYRPPNITSGRAVIPPIRSFRSSGSRKSLVLDMHVRRVSDESYEEDIGDTRDRTLRALEGRFEDDLAQITPPDSADAIGDNDNTADLFMRIAREDANQPPEEYERAGDQSAIVSAVRLDIFSTWAGLVGFLGRHDDSSSWGRCSSTGRFGGLCLPRTSVSGTYLPCVTRSYAHCSLLRSTIQQPPLFTAN